MCASTLLPVTPALLLNEPGIRLDIEEMIMSIWSYPNRGHWGQSSYRGNCSGFIYRDLYEALTPKVVIDPCIGSGTSMDVAREMGIESYGLDLHSGFNLLRDSILEATGKPGDLVVSHLPYHDMVVYSGSQYEGVHKDDLSRCESVDDFLEKAHFALLNQRDATSPGGWYATLIGDQRRNGRYYSYQAEFIARMPADELKSVIVKAQHNTVSGRKQYGAIGGGLPRIEHEYLLIWQRPEQISVLVTLKNLMNQARKRTESTWRGIVRQALVSLGGQAHLSDVYQHIEKSAPERLQNNQHWKAKIRQTLQKAPAFARVDTGVWQLS